MSESVVVVREARHVMTLEEPRKDLTRFAHHTGWRLREMLTLEWRDVQGDVIRLRPEIAKRKTARMIVVVGEVANIIDHRQQERVE